MIAEILNTGADNALTGRHLCKTLGISIRDLSAAVERERREGKPICANVAPPFGYYLASSRAEMETYCKSLAHRAREICVTRQACMKTLNDLPENGGT